MCYKPDKKDREHGAEWSHFVLGVLYDIGFDGKTVSITEEHGQADSVLVPIIRTYRWAAGAIVRDRYGNDVRHLL